jgi:hypothetical protein
MRLAPRSFDTMVPLRLSTGRIRSPCRHRQRSPLSTHVRLGQVRYPHEPLALGAEVAMQVMYERCVGLDVPKKTVVA